MWGKKNAMLWEKALLSTKRLTLSWRLRMGLWGKEGETATPVVGRREGV